MAADNWTQVTAKDFFADVAKANAESYKMQGHQWASRKRIPWVICRACGLVSLRNDLTRWCEKVGCLYERHPEFKIRVRQAKPRAYG